MIYVVAVNRLRDYEANLINSKANKRVWRLFVSGATYIKLRNEASNKFVFIAFKRKLLTLVKLTWSLVVLFTVEWLTS